MVAQRTAATTVQTSCDKKHADSQDVFKAKETHDLDMHINKHKTDTA
jgi:hypothetical protein